MVSIHASFLKSCAGAFRMRRVHLYRPPTGVAVLEVGKDRAVTMIDLFIAGIKVIDQAKAYKKYERQFQVISNTLKMLGFNPEKFYEERLLLKFKGRTILCSLYSSGSPQIVKYAALATFSPGALSRVVRRIESCGWKRKVMLELKSRKTART